MIIKNPSTIISGRHSKFLFVKIWASVCFHVFKTHKNPIKFFKILKGAIGMKSKYTKEKKYHNKLAYVDGRIFFNCNNAGWPAKHFFRMVDLETRKTLYNDVVYLYIAPFSILQL